LNSRFFPAFLGNFSKNFDPLVVNIPAVHRPSPAPLFCILQFALCVPETPIVLRCFAPYGESRSFLREAARSKSEIKNQKSEIRSRFSRLLVPAFTIFTPKIFPHHVRLLRIDGLRHWRVWRHFSSPAVLPGDAGGLKVASTARNHTGAGVELEALLPGEGHGQGDTDARI